LRTKPPVLAGSVFVRWRGTDGLRAAGGHEFDFGFCTHLKRFQSWLVTSLNGKPTS
jgi:hypothetical protein